MTTDQQRFASLLDRLEKVVTRLEADSGDSGADAGATSADGTPAHVAAYDEYVNEYLKPFLETMNKIGGDLPHMATIVEKGFNELRNLIVVASKSKRPSDDDLRKLLTPLSKVMEEAADYRQSKRPEDSFNHLSAVSEAIKAIGWPAVPNTPVPFVREMVDAAQFYTIKVLTQYRKSGPPEHVQFVEQIKVAIEQLAEYVKKYHTTGLKWNPSGGSALDAASSTAPAPAPTPAPTATATKSAAPSMGDVFSAINKGTAITAGLRKVDDSMKTKNRTDRVSKVPAEVSSKTPKVTPKFGSGAKMGTPKLELQGNKKWVVEYQQKQDNIVIDQTDMRHTVYVYKCVDSLLQIKGKVNAITLDSCQRVSLVFDNCVASVELVNCKSCKLQVTGKVPTITVDKTDGAQIYLSNESLDTAIVTSKSSEMNINVPDGDDFVEIPVPEQYTTTYDPATKKLVTEVNAME